MRDIEVEPGRGWLRLADPQWSDPLDATYSTVRGGRWTPVGGEPTLYLNHDIATARANVRRFFSGYSVQPEDLDPNRGYQLVTVVVPDCHAVVDASTVDGLDDVGLPGETYPYDATGDEVPHEVCQPIGAQAASDGRDGIFCRSAANPPGGRELHELAWFPRARHATLGPARVAFGQWYLGDPVS